MVFTSRTVTWHPALAAIWAIPDPIRPHPTTPTFSMAIDNSSKALTELAEGYSAGYEIVI
jgi:hypothetical protein